MEKLLSLPTLKTIIRKVTLKYVHLFTLEPSFILTSSQINPFSIAPVGPEPPILREDEEVPAVKWALSLRK